MDNRAKQPPPLPSRAWGSSNDSIGGNADFDMAALKSTLRRVDIAERWDSGRRDAVWLGLMRKRAQRRVKRASAAAIAMLALVVGVSQWLADERQTQGKALATGDGLSAPSGQPPAPQLATQGLPYGIVFEPQHQGDGQGDRAIAAAGNPAAAHAPVHGPQPADIDVRDNGERGVDIVLKRGQGRFRPAADGPHKDNDKARPPVYVHAGNVRITVQQSAFSVSQSDAGTDVWAHNRGVEVLWRGQSILIPAGKRRHFEYAPDPEAPADAASQGARAKSETRLRSRRARARTDAAGAADSAPEAAPEASPKASPKASIETAGVADWRALARRGAFAQARRALDRGDLGSRVNPTVEDRMLAADVYRGTGQHAHAAAQLKALLRDHARDAQAPLAAFTLGRILLDSLGQPAAAAHAFVRARALAPTGPLAEDALAREVESLAKAGQTQAAKKRAALYLRQYPTGHKRHAVRTYGGL